ncbi:MAG TPA: HNH endonuclease signature motif containing protein [Streptosporangiaceae bacterium]
MPELARPNSGNAPPGGPAAADSTVEPGLPAATPGDLCDATIIPILTGRVDQDLLDKLAAKLLRAEDNTAPDRETISSLILAHAIALLSGPGQVASLLRTGTQPGPAATISLPLDLGTTADTIPPHLRRAVIHRDRHCAAPGCHQPPAACHVHHLIVVHRRNWTITLNPDGTTTMRNPYSSRIYRSHSPPPATAA